MTSESRNSSLLGDGSVNTFPRKRTRITIEERCFLAGADPRLYNEDLTQLGSELSSGVGSWQNKGKKGSTLCKENFIMYCNYSETLMNPSPGYG
jgi:hypothetical protein